MCISESVVICTDVDHFAGEVGVSKFDELPFGAYNDPIMYVAFIFAFCYRHSFKLSY